MGLSGVLYARFGSLAYAAMAVMAGAAAWLRSPPTAWRGIGDRRCVSINDPERAVTYRQVGYIAASSRPLRYFIRGDRPPCRASQLRTSSG